MSENLQAWVELGALAEQTPTDLPGMSHVDGVWWYDAPLPPRLHRCKPWTISLFDDVERCACGALRFRHGRGSGSWAEKNSRKKSGE